jgi:hypothetical protein
MAVRSTMAALIARTRLLIGDPSGGSAAFTDQAIQDTLDEDRDDVSYELLTARPSIVNAASTNNIAQIIWADYYSKDQWWEDDLVIQGNIPNTGSWLVLTPLASDNLSGHWQFELTPFTNGTAPGQYPPVFIGYGKNYDVYLAGSKLLEMWAAALASSTFDFTQDGFNARASQIIEGKTKMANLYKARARVRTIRARRNDHPTGGHAERVTLLGEGDLFSGEGY